MTQDEITAELQKLRTQNKKIAKEQSDRFDAVEAARKALEDLINSGAAKPELVEAMTSLRTEMQEFDDVIPDAPTPA